MAGRRKRCAFCGGQAEGNFSIHRRPGQGPEVPLCDDCGAEDGPSCEEIWAVLALPGRTARERLAARTVELAAPGLRPDQVALVAASWASYMSCGDPGACMYGFDKDGLLQDEHQRQRCLKYIDECCLPLLTDPGYTQADADQLHALRRYIETAKVRQFLPDPNPNKGVL